MPSLAVSISYTYPTEPLIDGCSDPNYAISSSLNHQDTLPLNIVDKVIGILATQHGLSSLTANDGESEDENTLEGDEENHDEVFRTTNITDKRRRWRDVKGNWPPSGRWPIVAMTRVGAIMIRKRVRSEKKRWRVPRVGCLFSKGVTVMKMIEPVVNPSAMVRRRVIDSDSDDED